MNFKAVCAWCGKGISEGIEPVTHGICDACELILGVELDQSRRELEMKNVVDICGVLDEKRKFEGRIGRRLGLVCEDCGKELYEGNAVWGQINGEDQYLEWCIDCKLDNDVLEGLDD